jgi:hypothetical protein
MPPSSARQSFGRHECDEAKRARLPRLETVDQRPSRRLLPIGNSWTRSLYDGDFHLCPPPFGLPAVSLVFIQSSDGNTVIETAAKQSSDAVTRIHVDHYEVAAA